MMVRLRLLLIYVIIHCTICIFLPACSNELSTDNDYFEIPLGGKSRRLLGKKKGKHKDNTVRTYTSWGERDISRVITDKDILGEVNGEMRDFKSQQLLHAPHNRSDPSLTRDISQVKKEIRELEEEHSERAQSLARSKSLLSEIQESVTGPWKKQDAVVIISDLKKFLQHKNVTVNYRPERGKGSHGMLQIRNPSENSRTSFIFSSHTPYRAFKQFVDGVLKNIDALEGIEASEQKLKEDGECIERMSDIKREKEVILKQIKLLNDAEAKRLNETQNAIIKLQNTKTKIHGQIVKSFVAFGGKIKNYSISIGQNVLMLHDKSQRMSQEMVCLVRKECARWLKEALKMCKLGINMYEDGLIAANVSVKEIYEKIDDIGRLVAGFLKVKIKEREVLLKRLKECTQTILGPIIYILEECEHSINCVWKARFNFTEHETNTMSIHKKVELYCDAFL